jgi:hypothetical protein
MAVDQESVLGAAQGLAEQFAQKDLDPNEARRLVRACESLSWDIRRCQLLVDKARAAPSQRSRQTAQMVEALWELWQHSPHLRELTHEERVAAWLWAARLSRRAGRGESRERTFGPARPGRGKAVPRHQAPTRSSLPGNTPPMPARDARKEQKPEEVELLRKEGNKWRVRTRSGEELDCTGIPAYPPPQPGTTVLALVDRAAHKAKYVQRSTKSS